MFMLLMFMLYNLQVHLLLFCKSGVADVGITGSVKTKLNFNQFEMNCKFDYICVDLIIC